LIRAKKLRCGIENKQKAILTFLGLLRPTAVLSAKGKTFTIKLM
jgi:hypothetical protein